MRPKGSNYRISFDTRSALATTVGAALMLSPDSGLDADNASERLNVDSHAYATQNWLETVGDDSQFRGAALTPLFEATAPIDEWTTDLQKEFKELAVKEAEDKISAEGVNRLEQLAVLRRMYQHPRSADEVLWEFEQRRLTERLLATLKSYVEFYEGPSEAWRSTQKSSDRR
jgi:hypothetical protein